MTPQFITGLQVAVVLFSAPLVQGIMTSVTAFIKNRSRIAPWLPYKTLRTTLEKWASSDHHRAHHSKFAHLPVLIALGCSIALIPILLLVGVSNYTQGMGNIMVVAGIVALGAFFHALKSTDLVETKKQIRQSSSTLFALILTLGAIALVANTSDTMAFASLNWMTQYSLLPAAIALFLLAWSMRADIIIFSTFGLFAMTLLAPRLYTGPGDGDLPQVYVVLIVVAIAVLKLAVFAVVVALIDSLLPKIPTFSKAIKKWNIHFSVNTAFILVFAVLLSIGSIIASIITL